MDLLAEAGRFASDIVAPLNQTGDIAGCVRHDDGSVATPAGFVAAYRAYVEAGWGTVPFDPAYGGGGFPWVVGVALLEALASANLALSVCLLLTQGAIDMLEAHGDDHLRATYLPKLITGEWTGTMCLTEPDAGSDLGKQEMSRVPAGGVGDAGEHETGFLVGDEHQGMRYMFTMMNQARLLVGVQALGAAE